MAYVTLTFARKDQNGLTSFSVFRFQ